jgi:hypothetical protein
VLHRLISLSACPEVQWATDRWQLTHNMQVLRDNNNNWQ